MNYGVFLIVSVICLIASIVIAVIQGSRKYKCKRKVKPITVLLCGVVLSAFILLIPVYLNKFESGDSGVFEAVINSVYTTMRLFGMDGEFDLVIENLENVSVSVFKGYSILFSVLLVAVPLLTFGWALSLFKNISARIRYNLHFGSDTYIFSELNDKSVTLAESLYTNNPRRFFVFTDVTEIEQLSELIERIKQIGAVCFKKDITATNFSFHSKKKTLNFFTIGEEQSQNIGLALSLIKKFENRDNTNLYVFSTLPQSEILLSNAYKNSVSEKIKVRRINEVQSLINRILYYDGFEKIFGSAVTNSDGIKKINAFIIGMGQHGCEMAKALTWFGQMDGYLIGIDSFDINTDTEEKFTHLYPELMEFSGKVNIDGESKYTLSIHSGVDVNSVKFDKIINQTDTPTYIFVALGNDELNISTAIKIRTLLAKKDCFPKIQAVVYDTEKSRALTDITNYKKQRYDIDFIGDFDESYSEEVILNSEIESEALKRHLRWGDEREFWQFDYNYRSSVASAIHRKMKILCGIPGAEKSMQERTESQLWNLRKLEHCRWNAYVRSEGYTYGGTTDRKGRNDLAKTHNCLVPFDQLPLEEQVKDDD